MEGGAAMLYSSGAYLPGAIDCADGFGEVAFTTTATLGTLKGRVEVHYWHGGQLYRFTTWVLSQPTSYRLRLVRPRRVFAMHQSQHAA